MNVLILPHLKIHNANALSSPFTIGFPAMTAWLGFVHALERKLSQAGLSDLMLHSAAVVSHWCDVQAHKGEGDFVHSIIGTGNPLDKDGSRSAFIEEARCHLDVSLVIEWSGNKDEVQQPEFTQQLQAVIATMKVAGGDVLAVGKPSVKSVITEDDTGRILRQLMPGYVLIERRDLMIDAMQQGDDAIDALLGYLTVHHHCEQLEDQSVVWHSQRKTSGWIVPIATGFQGISPLGEAKNQRDPSVPHRFAESVVTLGEFVMAHKIKHLDDILWQYHPDLENDLYLCQQVNAINEHQ
ncbi:type I-F CRISPR-associated protein Csy2 [Shewanella xiamenensis]|uniref:type I-F CRISPR-associated protein Csy2 n=1 Tax=Shewanella xiamenensis TaxID=332186 RepID=UPI0024A7A491|nr:type I-F CRISPR-associated protein Csy2 [Shewanella xiamenensis]MDI5835468.1 type I-F CRISPR-associated protein Csy2 [Shewanella xiamenensis]MDI5840562.1 type I-F CRISPR-associated protein Csy2 [Shewanella xiamenensis]MDI5844541.1 type I-F CRISPR-associated protein Csy2 [Shewanella xiamenensis]MDI5847095.1 type I-F CRISPR-associated protein Csy2 [Shewanella xiamenensis]MDI5860383.1 type I-F CRISPR-associated protein Csy2 [Shewanella xiamenensis]